MTTPTMSKQRAWVKKCWDYHSLRISEIDVAVDWGAFDTEGNRCWCCGHSSYRLQRCHIVPKSLEGSDHPSNIVPMCAQCHDRAPDVADYFAMFDWIKKEQNPLSGLGAGRIYVYYLLLMEELESANVDPGMVHITKLMRYIEDAFKSASLHCSQAGTGVHFSMATRRYVYQQAVRRYKAVTGS